MTIRRTLADHQIDAIAAARWAATEPRPQTVIVPELPGLGAVMLGFALAPLAWCVLCGATWLGLHLLRWAL